MVNLPEVEAVAALTDDVRRRLYEAVRAARSPVTREAAAQAVGVSRKLAAFHLDKLVAVGLLTAGADTAVPRRVGRAPKAYSPVASSMVVSVPPRRHLDLADLLVEAVSRPEPGVTAHETARRLAAERGRGAVAARTRTSAGGPRTADSALRVVEGVLKEQGFEPYRPGAGCLRLHNCPFEPLATRAPELVCGLNAAFLGGVVDEVAPTELELVGLAGTDECCAEIRQRQ